MINIEKCILLLAAFLSTQLVSAGELQGTLSWSRISTLGFAVPGIVESVPVQAGMRVNKGQLLVQLEQRPFILGMKKYKANSETIEPLLFDSKIELSQAEELFDRTVLSQVELQKIEARHRGLEAQARVAQMELELAKWRLHKSTLLAPFDGLVISNGFTPGKIISEENRGNVALLLAPAGIMSVTVYAGTEDLAALTVNQSVKVALGSEQLPGIVKQVDMQPGEKGLFRSVIEFKYPQNKAYYAGQAAKIIY